MHSLGSAAPHLPLEGDLPADHWHLRHLRTQCRYLHYISRYIYTRYLCISTVCTRVTPPPRQVPASPCVCSMAVSGWAWWQRRPWPGSRRNTWVVCHHYIHSTQYTIYTAPCSAGCHAASWRPISQGCSRPRHCRRTRPGARGQAKIVCCCLSVSHYYNIANY